MTAMKPSVMTRIIIPVFLSVLVGSANADLTVIPSDTEVKVGQPVRFLCSTSKRELEIQWFRTPVGAQEKDLVYGFKRFMPNYENRFQLENNFATGASNLLIPSVEIGDAGKYICQDEGGTGNRSSAQLIVLESIPVCQSNMRTDEVVGPNSCGIDADNLVLSCSVSHHGNVRPELVWSKVGENSPITKGVTFATVENTTTFNLSMKGDLAMDHTSYICQAARATPGDPMKCTSDAVKILYAFNSFSIIDKQLNDYVHCTANSSQSCTYEWMYYHEGTEKTFEPGRNRTLKDVGLYTCEANCKIKQKPCIVSVSLVHVIDQAEGERTALIVILILLAVAFIAVLVLLFVRRRSWSRNLKHLGKTSQHNDPTGRASTLSKPTSCKAHRLLSEASVELISTTLSTNVLYDPQITATNAEYCALGDRPPAAQESELYCELSLNVQPGKDYMNYQPKQQ